MRDRRNNSRIAVALQSGTFVMDTMVYGIGPIDQGFLRLSRICPHFPPANSLNVGLQIVQF
jgi:hypothetical protein